MTARRGIRLGDVVDVATELVEAEGAESLTLSGVARELGIKTPSLYSHVDDIDALRRHVALKATEQLGDKLIAAAMGRSGRSALDAVAHAFRHYATTHQGMYQLSARARPDDEEYEQAGLRALQPVIAVLRDYALDDAETIHAARLLRSAIHGFVSLEIHGGFGLDTDVDESFEWMVKKLAIALGGSATSIE